MEDKVVGNENYSQQQVTLHTTLCVCVCVHARTYARVHVMEVGEEGAGGVGQDHVHHPFV